MGALENKCQLPKMTSCSWNFQNFTRVFKILVKYDIITFSRAPIGNFFGVITDT